MEYKFTKTFRYQGYYNLMEVLEAETGYVLKEDDHITISAAIIKMQNNHFLNRLMIIRGGNRKEKIERDGLTPIPTFYAGEGQGCFPFVLDKSGRDILHIPAHQTVEFVVEICNPSTCECLQRGDDVDQESTVGNSDES